MKRSPIPIIFACMLSSAMARAEWVQVGENEDSVTYADIGSKSRAGKLAKMWYLNDLKAEQTTLVTMSAGHPYLSTRVQDEYDCIEKKVRGISFEVYSGNMGNGNIVLSDYHAGSWSAISPASIEETRWKLACR
jgi:hypothetical protein